MCDAFKDRLQEEWIGSRLKATDKLGKSESIERWAKAQFGFGLFMDFVWRYQKYRITLALSFQPGTSFNFSFPGIWNIWQVLLWLDALNAKNISGAVENAQAQAFHWQYQGEKKRRVCCCSGRFLVDVQVYSILRYKSCHDMITSINILSNSSISFPQHPLDAGWRKSLYLEADDQSNDKQRKQDYFIEMQPKYSLAVCHVCSCVHFCPCLSQQSSLIY